MIDVGNHHSVTQFSALIQQSHIIISGDTLPMHLAIGHKKHVLAIFGPTCPQEIDLYDRGEILMSPIECAPCYKQSCDVVNHCMIQISPELVCKKAFQLVESFRC